MQFKEFYNEAIRKMNDEKVDKFIQDNWNGEAHTYPYNAEAVIKLSKIFKDIITTKDMKYFHIPAINTESDNIIKQYNLKEVK